MSPVRYRQLGQLWREAGPPQARFCKGPAMATTTTLRKTYLRKDKMPHGRVRGKSVRENPVFCLHFSTSRSTLLGNTLIFHKVESVSAMTAIGQWSPFPVTILTHKLFHLIFSFVLLRRAVRAHLATAVHGQPTTWWILFNKKSETLEEIGENSFTKLWQIQPFLHLRETMRSKP